MHSSTFVSPLAFTQYMHMHSVASGYAYLVHGKESSIPVERTARLSHLMVDPVPLPAEADINLHVIKPPPPCSLISLLVKDKLAQEQKAGHSPHQVHEELGNVQQLLS